MTRTDIEILLTQGKVEARIDGIKNPVIITGILDDGELICHDSHGTAYYYVTPRMVLEADLID